MYMYICLCNHSSIKWTKILNAASESVKIGNNASCDIEY